MYKLGIQTTSGGKDIFVSVFSVATEKDKALLNRIIINLRKDGRLALEQLETKQEKKPLFKIVKGNWRIFYVIVDGIVILLHCTYKTKNKTELHDQALAMRRAKQLSNIRYC